MLLSNGVNSLRDYSVFGAMLKDDDFSSATDDTLPRPTNTDDQQPQKKPATQLIFDDPESGKFYTFAERVIQLKDYQETFGHINLKKHPEKSEFDSLRNWVAKQRREYKLFKHGANSTLNAEKIKILESVGIVWKPSFTWYEMYQKLCRHKELYGSVDIPSRYKNRKYNRLGKWLYIQRHRYKLFKQGKRTPMKLEHICLLENLGVNWEMKRPCNGCTPNTYECMESQVPTRQDIIATRLTMADTAVEAKALVDLTEPEFKSNVLDCHHVDDGKRDAEPESAKAMGDCDEKREDYWSFGQDASKVSSDLGVSNLRTNTINLFLPSPHQTSINTDDSVSKKGFGQDKNFFEYYKGQENEGNCSDESDDYSLVV